MSALATLLVLGSALMHATWNLFAKRSQNKLAFLWLVNIAAIVVYLPVFIYTLLHNPIPAEGWPFIVGTGLTHIVYIVCLSQAYSHGALSLTYPVSRGTGVALVPMLAIPVFAESVSVAGAAGVLLVISGMIALHATPIRDIMRRTTTIRGSVPEGTGAGLMFALFTGIAIATYSLIDKGGVARVHPIVYGYFIYINMTIGLTPWVFSRLRSVIRTEWSINRTTIILGGILSLGTYLIILGAMQIAPVSYIVPLREVSVLFAAMLGVLFLGEGFGRDRLAGATLIAGGVVLISTFG